MKIPIQTALLAVVLIAMTSQARIASAGYKPMEVKDGGTIVGTVTWEGAIPEQKIMKASGPDKVCHTKPIPNEDIVVSKDAKVRWVVAYIKKIKQGKPFKTDPTILDQHGCRFIPHVVTVPKGHTLRILNSDGVLHNVHLRATKNEPLNTSMPGDMKKLDLKFDYSERMHIACDVHKWMSAWVIVSKNPYYAVTGEDGSFRLENVPPGTYTVEIWHEKLGRKRTKVTVKPNSESRVEFVLKEKKKK